MGWGAVNGGAGRNAGPSTSLRCAQDDKFFGWGEIVDRLEWIVWNFPGCRGVLSARRAVCTYGSSGKGMGRICYGSVFVQRVKKMKRFAWVAFCGAMLAAGNFGGGAWAQAIPAQAGTAATAAATAAAPAATQPSVEASAATGASTGAAAGADGIIKGTVMAGTTPLPGVAVTATDTATGK
ncbi:MAG TPA: hypothetical protein VGU23_08095, partial [Acidobacteriaceae bacterium]|nr:hypothetical protein [Acidobacteriaceae bacterium]